MQKAAKIACADSFIEKLPDGYNTVISGSNASLSQGQNNCFQLQDVPSVILLF